MIRHIANINTSKSTGKRREEKIAIIREPAGNLQKYMKLKSHAELKFVNSRWGCGVFAQWTCLYRLRITRTERLPCYRCFHVKISKEREKKPSGCGVQAEPITPIKNLHQWVPLPQVPKSAPWPCKTQGATVICGLIYDKEEGGRTEDMAFYPNFCLKKRRWKWCWSIIDDGGVPFLSKNRLLIRFCLEATSCSSLENGKNLRPHLDDGSNWIKSSWSGMELSVHG